MFVACQNKKQMQAAKDNAIAYATARCECEKLEAQTPPGDTQRCIERMALAQRYLNINYELGKFSDAARREVEAAGDAAYKTCSESAKK